MTGRIVCFGELLLRFTAPGRELLMQSGRMDVHVGGAEANVAVGLSCLDHSTAMVSAVPDNHLGRGAISALRARGVDTSGVQLRDGRMGLYFLSAGAGLRASDIIYDRSTSAFANAPSDAFDWSTLLCGANRLHLSGITPALGPTMASSAIRAAEAAKEMGVPISFDGNYRSRLWAAWDSNPTTVLSKLVGMSDLFFGNHRDVSLLLGREFSGDGSDRRREAAQAAFDAFPNLNYIASTARQVDDADRHRISARIDARGEYYQTEAVIVSGIIDRIGGGDAYATGILHGILTNQSLGQTARSGLALTCLKHSLPGDFSLFSRADIAAFLNGDLDVRR